MNACEALSYLRERVAEVEARESRHRPHWSVADIEAIAYLTRRRPAAEEQIALARIEGIAYAVIGRTAEWKTVRNIARRALGLPVSP